MSVPLVEDFGEQLVKSLDLDPLYVGLHNLFPHRSAEYQANWCFAYWCCYHAGASSWIADQPTETYWGWMAQMAQNIDPPSSRLGWPRGRERRHFRGAAAVNAVNVYRQHTPLSIVFHWASAGPSFHSIKKAVTAFPQFGPWIAFKVADMLERVLGVEVVFEQVDVLYKQPLEAALDVYSYRNLGEETLPQQEKAAKAMQFVIGQLRNLSAPPRFDRPFGLQEAETVLCKWKSHLNGHYPVGLDTRELRHGLEQWAGISKSAEQLLQGMP